MTLIHVPRPPKGAIDRARPVNALLKTQIEHLHQAEKRLPLRYHTQTYVNAIKTEAEAGNYIRQVTEAIQKAHEDAARQRATSGEKRKLTAAAPAGGRHRTLRRSGRTKAKKMTEASRPS